MKRNNLDLVFRLLMLPITILLCSTLSHAGTDSTKVFGFEEFMGWVKQHHPVMARATIITEQAENNLLHARGNFDPQIQGDFNQKDYGDKTYYRIAQGGLFVPAWFGADVTVNYRYSEGEQLDPQNYVPDPGIMEFGISVPLSPALWMDKRRAALKNAKLYTQSAGWQQIDLTNQLYLESALDYWDWALQYERLAVFEEALAIAERQYNQVRNGVLAGDRAAIDTIEAALLLQQVRINLTEAQMLSQNAKYQLGVHLWLEGNVPLEVSDELIPESILSISTYWNIPADESFLDAHPLVNTLLIDKQMQLVDQQLYKASLFPKIKLKYQMLAGLEPLEFDFETGGNTLQNNHALGVGLSIPIFWANERANLYQSKLKIRDTDLKIALKSIELTTKYKQLSNQATTYNDQIVLLNENVAGYRIMVNAEETLLYQGESSLFMINARVNKLLDAQLKLAELHFKRQKTYVYWYVMAGKGF